MIEFERKIQFGNVLKVLLQSEQDFSKFLCKVRRESGVPAEQLAEGLMDLSQYSRVESGQRPVYKNMRDCLLGRLGITSDMYENMLNVGDYAVWEQQHNILCAIEQREFQKAWQLIEAYEKESMPMDKIGLQFCLMMKAEILKLQGADGVKLAGFYEKAVRLTVPEVEQLYTKKKLLSVQEVNVVLEYEYYCNRYEKEEFIGRCMFLMNYVEVFPNDELSKAKIYPKLAYYYLQERFAECDSMTLEKLYEGLQTCNKAVEMLRDTSRAFYLVELLEYKGKILACIIKNLTKSGKIQEAEEQKMVLHESAELDKLLKDLYIEYDVPAYMQDCTYLYRQRWVFSIGDVLRIRRNMYGLTQQELCEGICSVKTLRRAEKKQVNMQREILGEILKRLGLSKELQRTEIVTNDIEALRLKEKLTFCRNNREVETSRELLNILKEKICLEIPENLQYIMEAEVSLDWMEGKITKEEFVTRERAALGCTLMIKKLQDIGEIYLTEMEISCICKIMQKLGDTEKTERIDFLLKFFEKYEKTHTLDCYIVMYEFVMVCITSELGNMGEYQLATDLDKKALKEVLRCRRFCEVSSYLYDILWNEKEQNMGEEKVMDKEKMAYGLKQCLVFSHFCKRTFDEKIYYDKLFYVV